MHKTKLISELQNANKNSFDIYKYFALMCLGKTSFINIFSFQGYRIGF